MIPALPANLPSVSKARLPEVYQQAKTTLEKCTRVDECQDWADKAEALASYAKQAGDSSLREMADRIQGRAIRRCGELLRSLKPPGQVGRPAKNGEGTRPISHAASDAGLSEHQRKTALRVAAVPAADFEAAIESETPPTITELADRGTRHQPKPLIDLHGRDPKEFSISTQVQARLDSLFEISREVLPEVVVRGALDAERQGIEDAAMGLMAWIERLLVELRKKDGKQR